MLRRTKAWLEKLDTAPKLPALSQREFLKLSGSQFALQAAVVIPWLVALSIARAHHRIDLVMYLCLAVIVPVIYLEKRFNRLDVPRRRLMALYPNQPLPNSLYSQFLRAFPIVGFPVYCFLAAKREPSRKPMPWILATSLRLFFITALLPLCLAVFVAMTSIGKGVALWTLEPATLYLVNLVGEGKMALQEHQRIQTLGATDAYKPSDAAKSALSSTTGTIFLMVAAVKQAHLIPENEPALRTRILFDGILNVVDASENLKPTEFRMNPLFYLSPVGVASVSLLTEIESYLDIQFNNQFVAAISSKLAETKSPEFINRYTTRLAESRIFKTAAIVRETSLGRFLTSDESASLASSK